MSEIRKFFAKIRVFPTGDSFIKLSGGFWQRSVIFWKRKQPDGHQRVFAVNVAVSEGFREKIMLALQLFLTMLPSSQNCYLIYPLKRRTGELQLAVSNAFA